MPYRILFLVGLFLLAMINAPRAEQLHVLAAGSLREVLGAIGTQYRGTTGIDMTTDFGPSGVLRERIENGERADLFASADVGHPLKLLKEGLATRVAMFTRNRLCGFAVPKVGLTTANFIDKLLDPAVKLGTSTPKSDPSGDYTWAMFHKIDALRPGSYAVLDKKAQKIVGGPSNSAPVDGKDPVIAVFAAGRIDLFIGYCSGAKRLLAQMPTLRVAGVPSAIATGPEYGLAVLKMRRRKHPTSHCSCCPRAASRFSPITALRPLHCRCPIIDGSTASQFTGADCAQGEQRSSD